MRLPFLLLFPLATVAAEPRLPVAEVVKGSLLERVEAPPIADSPRFDFRLQDMGAVPAPVPGSRIHKLRDFENRVTCYVLSPAHPEPKSASGSISCVKD